MVTKTLEHGVIQQKEILNDYYICVKSREISIHIRKDVLGGKAKFGVSDDGKELFQVALAKSSIKEIIEQIIIVGTHFYWHSK